MMATFTTANTILEDAGTIIYLMKELVLSEKLERPENAGAIHLRKPVLNISKRECFRTVMDGSIDEYADSRGTDAMMFKEMF